jgi:hypothetical protein
VGVVLAALIFLGAISVFAFHLASGTPVVNGANPNAPAPTIRTFLVPRITFTTSLINPSEMQVAWRITNIGTTGMQLTCFFLSALPTLGRAATIKVSGSHVNPSGEISTGDLLAGKTETGIAVLRLASPADPTSVLQKNPALTCLP